MHIDPGKNAQWGADRVIVIGFQGRRRRGGHSMSGQEGGGPLGRVLEGGGNQMGCVMISYGRLVEPSLIGLSRAGSL